jgi:hypothetical protein
MLFDIDKSMLMVENKHKLTPVDVATSNTIKV